jgi:acyl-CoA hydrolase
METLTRPEACVDAVLSRVGKRILLGTPLGIGKPNHLLNAFYRRAQQDPGIELVIHTALTLQRPRGKSLLEQRFLGPMVERVFGNYPDLAYELDRMAGKLPANVRVLEFYFQAGKYLRNENAQRDYISSNYTHVARDLHARGVNVIAQQVCAGVVKGRPLLSLSSNPDLSLDLLAKLRADEKAGKAVAAIAQLNEQLPFMHGDALIAPDAFDFVVDDPQGSYTLFGPPKLSVGAADHMIGLYASALVRDGGELQVGIGALGDAIVYALKLRHEQNALYQEALQKLGVSTRAKEIVAHAGGTGPFVQGLFSATEMFVDGFAHLFDAGILKRKVYDDVALSRLLNEGRIDERVTPELLDLLRGRRAIRTVLTESDLAYLQHFGIVRDELRYDEGWLVAPDGRRVLPNLEDPEARAVLHAYLGTTLEHGAVLHAGFFLGPPAFYEWLRKLPEDKRKLIDMRSVTRINQLYGHEEIDRLHRRDARFVNTCMMMTMLGAAVSDALEDGRVVSGVGGQYNFVAMAHELPGGRSVLQVRSTRHDGGELRSNLVWSYGHTTIARHLRDVVITEYGIADLRGKTDEECVIAMLAIADSRFQDALMAEAKRNGKLRADYRIPEAQRRNLPEAYEPELKKLQARGVFPTFPFGTDLTAEEQTIGKALRALEAATATKAGLARVVASAALHGTPGPDVDALLRRMDLHAPRSFEERMYQRLLASALRGHV